MQNKMLHVSFIALFIYYKQSFRLILGKFTSFLLFSWLKALYSPVI